MEAKGKKGMKMAGASDFAPILSTESIIQELVASKSKLAVIRDSFGLRSASARGLIGMAIDHIDAAIKLER